MIYELRVYRVVQGRMAVSALFIAAGIATASPVFAGTERGSQNLADTSDAALAASLPGDFRNGYAEVNGTRIHYVEGGKGTPVLLLAGLAPDLVGVP